MNGELAQRVALVMLGNEEPFRGRHSPKNHWKNHEKLGQ